MEVLERPSVGDEAPEDRQPLRSLDKETVGYGGLHITARDVGTTAFEALVRDIAPVRVDAGFTGAVQDTTITRPDGSKHTITDADDFE